MLRAKEEKGEEGITIGIELTLMVSRREDIVFAGFGVDAIACLSRLKGVIGEDRL